jgi:hypothetical protein
VKTEHKVRKEKKQKHLTKPVDLSLKSMTEGANIGLELGKILQARKSRTVDQKLDECSQQVGLKENFEYIFGYDFYSNSRRL